jgi:hypothetical protein
MTHKSMKRLLVIIAILIGTAPIAVSQACKYCPQSSQESQHDATDRKQQEQGQDKGPAIPPKLENLERPEFARFDPILSLTNNAAKMIKQVTWECTLKDHTSGETVASYTFVTRKRIAPGRSAVLKERIFIPLSQLLAHPRVLQVGKENSPASRHPEVEQTIEITEIRYNDGSISHP